MKRRWLAVVAVTSVLALSAVACGGKGGGGSTPSATASGIAKDAKIAAEVPSAIASKGTVTVAADATYAPDEFIPPGTNTVEGMDVDLGHAIGDLLGLKFNFVNSTFDTIIPGLASGKYDIGMSSFTDTKEREATVDFVTYYSAGTSFYVQASGGPNVTGLDSLCGLKVGVESGTTEQHDSTAQSSKCTAAGKPAVSVQPFPDQSSANLALSAGRVQVVMADSPVAAYAVKQSNGQFKLSGQAYGTAPYGIAVPKGSGMAQPILDALKKLMGDGTYMQILQKWGMQDGAINNPVINGAIY